MQFLFFICFIGVRKGVRVLIIPKITNNIYPIRQTVFNTAQKYGNLAPLSRDTVSFGATKKEIWNDEQDGNIYGISEKDAREIQKEAVAPAKYLDIKLNEILGDLVKPAKNADTSQYPIQEIKTRIKDDYSIVEKSKTRKWNSKEEVTKNMTDIVGARIIMADTTKEKVDRVIDRITNAVEKNQIKILEIENYRPDPEENEYGAIIKTYDYASSASLKRLKLACDEANNSSIRKVDEDMPSGYMAIHMLVQLPNGYTGEIQILGEEVERLKDVEDMAFKVKNGKHLKKYPNVEKSIKVLANRDDVILRKEFNRYTRDAYLYQREKELQKGRGRIDKRFLSIPVYLPKNLDFNEIEKEINDKI